MDLANKKVVVLGLGKRTGVAVAKFLVKAGAEVVVSDLQPADKLTEQLAELEDYSLEFDLGGHSEKVIADTDLIVISPGVPSQIDILKKARELGIPIWSEIELAYRFTKADILATTGTNGKTTTTTLLGEIFTAAEAEVKVGGNIGCPLISCVPQLSEQGVVIAEISSFQLENVERFRPQIALILNLTPDHLDRHSSWEDYVAAKAEITAQQLEDDYLVLNYDDQTVRDLAAKSAAEVVYFSQKEELAGGLYVKDGVVINDLTAQQESLIRVEEIGIKGPHNLENVLGAIAISLLRGLSIEVINFTLKNFQGVEHRIEEIVTIEGVKYINDSKATNVAAATKALETFEAPLILIAGGMDKGACFTEFAKKIADNVKHLILLGETADQIEESTLNSGLDNIQRVNSISQAVKWADQLSTSGDVVLLSPACASWDMFSSYKERGNKFKQAVMSLRGK
ncbi:UDP-N-acetylmuramoyl-L-alanine--D-glutamate ligase [Fuchsiella alkaliacetigena]|uniref:UDP-N-acetylmuramoyl-L-alanine--D-glutamate ligase n=1 Tax=Fuchsiella alkaliacetigena TaxID=957042 RepID=UPI00200A8FFC|nr:UDP-N-acetylmuramoyl-L-alanine--D-glutamate ligase [Fuchsiella alkaliacetigena]MCK8823675.1 UDP-N-acetylmuramoyl-L-alanine--D-glutamate ligase [Fuchsiella alkaliacetigena]